MTVVKTYCDKCGRALDKVRDYDNTDIEICEYLKNVDLCCECFEKLTEHIEKFFEEKIENGKQ